ncbi:alpha/beta hydrolase [Sphingomonas montanisoli]|uniref:Alpha/beta hydrolase n=1 Tax=Sphingomonas montanisoli TaxID=2606412 RepID=A0A5D9CF94_9SPHN|nr:alpha/beta hydrolase [Sphingomonas montanisoli]TZG28775.1 alpha/beta hydrolase [Sphingomonas montanisoli]
MMRLTLIGLAVLVVGTLIAGACSPLKTFDAILPKDGGSREVATNVPYGVGPRRTLDIYAPRDMPAGKPKPVIFFIYGGSWANGTKDGYAFAGRALAASGFVVVIADYRLVPEVYFPGFLQDCAAAFHWTVANIGRYGGDSGRIVLAGHSAGAYNAAMLALDPQWLGDDRAAVKGFAGLAGPYDFLPLDGPIPVKTFGQWPRLDETQPIHFAAASAPPMLLLHGSKDDTVWPKNSINLDRRLRELGARSELKVYEGTGHVGIVTALAKPFRGNAPSLADVTAFAHRVAGN